MKAEALRCNYCNGFVDPKTYKCPYCGTQYVKPRLEPYKMPDMKIVSVNAPVDVIGCQVAIPFDRFKTMADIGVPIEQEVRRDMANQIADAITDKIEIYEDFDITGYQKKYTARLRVVKPDFRF